MGSEDAERIRQALKELDAIQRTCYNKGEYGRGAAALDIWNALIYKLPETTFGMGLAYVRGKHIPQVFHALGMVAEKGDAYQQTLMDMASEQSMRLANSDSYGAAIAASGIYDLAKLPFNLMKEGKGLLKGEVLGRALDAFAQNLADYLYQQAAEE